MLLKAVVLFVLFKSIVAEELQPVENIRGNLTDKMLVSTTVGTKTFYIEFAKLNFYKALEQCAAHNWQLARIESEPEQEAVVEMINNYAFRNEHYWIAGNCLGYSTARNWFWMTTGKPITFTKWGPGQPDNQGGVENCVHVHRAFGFQWNDMPCENEYFYICEKVGGNCG